MYWSVVFLWGCCEWIFYYWLLQVDSLFFICFWIKSQPPEVWKFNRSIWLVHFFIWTNTRCSLLHQLKSNWIKWNWFSFSSRNQVWKLCLFFKAFWLVTNCLGHFLLLVSYLEINGCIAHNITITKTIFVVGSYVGYIGMYKLIRAYTSICRSY